MKYRDKRKLRYHQFGKSEGRKGIGRVTAERFKEQDGIGEVL